MPSNLHHVMREKDGATAVAACRTADGAAWELMRLQANDREAVYWKEPAPNCSGCRP